MREQILIIIACKALPPTRARGNSAIQQSLLNYEMSYNLADKIQVPTQTSLLVVKDTPYVSGNFILTHLLHSYLKANQSVCFVSLEHSFFHYLSVTRKMVIIS
jgi:hypothetical protein